MDFITKLIAFFAEHWDAIAGAIVGLIAVATTIVGLTPTDKDNKILAKIVAFLDYFSLLNPKGSITIKPQDVNGEAKK